MKQRGLLGQINSESENSQTKNIEKQKQKTPSKLQQQGEFVSFSPLQLTQNTMPFDQFQLQGQAKSNNNTKQNSSVIILHNFLTQTQLIQTTIKVFHEKYENFKILKESNLCQIVQCRNIFTKEYFIAKICLKGQNSQINSEIRVCNTLLKQHHSGLMKLQEMFSDKDTHIFVYEYMNGGTLFEYIQKKHLKLDESEVRSIFKQILKALKHLHSLNIIHRDLKLDNIMFKVKGDVKSLKLIDFGYATLLSDTKNMKFRCGTPGYVAPEIYQESLLYNQLCDIYSLGAIAHILATGKRIYSSNLTSKEICEFNRLNQYEIHENLKCPLLLDLITQMLKEFTSRPSAQDCLIHPYFIKFSQFKVSQDRINQQIYNLTFPQFKNPFQSYYQQK
ncbi:unnamed protein product [Paramecium primaurelia]|uniref:Protein kinase domain-containing protein n=1 Tax=Paramecium primaurelia TaxID=5886 RepID=A0A8S1K0S7_PARPR|nr:unnamed protein product [Paramecium primaurelia]